MKKQVSIGLKSSIKLMAILLFIIIVGCEKSEYAKLVKSEMNKDIVKDSLIFEMKFGQTKKLFFDQCWELNNKKIINQGTSNKFVEYKLPIKEGDTTKNPITMLFYGILMSKK